MSNWGQIDDDLRGYSEMRIRLVKYDESAMAEIDYLTTELEIYKVNAHIKQIEIDELLSQIDDLRSRLQER